MGRYISFAVLFGILIVIGILFYKVMIGFFVPVFMAVVLVVVFRPLHRWVLAKVGDRDHVAASITTCLIGLIVLFPTGLVLTMAAVQGVKLAKQFDRESIDFGLRRLRSNNFVPLEMPCSRQLQTIQTKIKEIQEAVAKDTPLAEMLSPTGRLAGEGREIKKQLAEIPRELITFEKSKLETRIISARRRANEAVVATDIQKAIDPLIEDLDQWIKSLPIDSKAVIDKEAESKVAKELLKKEPTSESLSSLENHWAMDSRTNIVNTGMVWIEQVRKMNHEIDERLLGEGDKTPPEDLVALQESVWLLSGIWQNSRETILGGSWYAYLKELANPSRESLSKLTSQAVEYLQPQLITFTGDSVKLIVQVLIGLSVLMLSLYFFLCDGPGMVRSLMDLSPLDDRYEMELLAEFDRTVRAIVVATILSAIVQGLTAGIGYYFAGVPSLLMLTAVTAVCALIPFFGTGIVWVPVCIYLALYEERFMAAGILALWGFLVVGTVDNLVKMFVLHGQSQLHPLLALLSVLGGIQTLGPIGIVVGPMAVTLLQTTLGIMRHELTQMKDNEQVGIPVEGSVDLAIKPLSGLIRKVKGGSPGLDAEDAAQTTSDAHAIDDKKPKVETSSDESKTPK